MQMSDYYDYASNTGVFGNQIFEETINLSGQFRIPTGANPNFHDQMQNNGGSAIFGLQLYVFPSNSPNIYQGPPVSYYSANYSANLTGSYYDVIWNATGIAIPVWEEDTSILLAMINAI